MLLASVTDSLVNLATHLIRDLGVGGVAFMTATSGVIGVPGSEPTMLFAGFNVYQGHLTLPGIIAFGVLGDLVGASIAYAIAYFGSRELLERHGAKIHLSQRRVDRAHAWFAQYGTPVIVLSRLIPFARAAFPYAAGLAEMGYARFIALSAVGSVIWITALGVLGRQVGSDWPSWRHNLEYVDYAVIAIVVVGIVYLLIRRSRGPGDPTVDAVSD